MPLLRRFQSYEESSDGVDVTYTEAGEPKKVHCKVLVGADGYFSAVRQQCLGDGSPDFAVSQGPAAMHAQIMHGSQAVFCRSCIAAFSTPLTGCRNAEHCDCAMILNKSAILGLFMQGTVFWRARLKVNEVHEKPQWFFGGEK